MSRGRPSGDGVSGNTRLSVIAEDENQQPPRIAHPKLIRTSNRSAHRRWGDLPPRHSFEAPPPGYELDLKEEPPEKRRRFFGLQNNPHIARRGGWKRLLIVVLIVVAIVIALGVGLGVGLRQRNSSSAPPPPPAPTSFPIGSWAIDTYLVRVATSCTSNPTAFTCNPYQTYNSSPSGSLSTFDWTISAQNDDPNNLTISTSPNPFANTFTNVPLTLQNAGTPDEHYYFSLPLQKVDIVAGQNLTTNGDVGEANCYYNQTTFEGLLFTKKPAQNTTAGGNSTDSGGMSSPSAHSNGTGWEAWPNAANITQSVHGGANVPNCYGVAGFGHQQSGALPGFEPQSEDKVCECQWLNFDL